MYAQMDMERARFTIGEYEGSGAPEEWAKCRRWQVIALASGQQMDIVCREVNKKMYPRRRMGTNGGTRE